MANRPAPSLAVLLILPTLAACAGNGSGGAVPSATPDPTPSPSGTPSPSLRVSKASPTPLASAAPTLVIPASPTATLLADTVPVTVPGSAISLRAPRFLTANSLERFTNPNSPFYSETIDKGGVRLVYTDDRADAPGLWLGGATLIVALQPAGDPATVGRAWLETYVLDGLRSWSDVPLPVTAERPIETPLGPAAVSSLVAQGLFPEVVPPAAGMRAELGIWVAAVPLPRGAGTLVIYAGSSGSDATSLWRGIFRASVSSLSGS